MKLIFFPSFFVCGHGDVGLSQCSVLKEEATFLSCMRHFLCAEKSRSLFFFISNLCSVCVSPDVFPAGESKTGPSEMEAAAEDALDWSRVGKVSPPTSLKWGQNLGVLLAVT